MLSSTINNLIFDLKPREREVLAGRFGLEKNKRETLAGLGEKYDITRERVRQIEAEALRKLREEARREHLLKPLERISRHLESVGGLRREDLFVEELRGILGDGDLHSLHLGLLSAVLGEPYFYPDDGEFHSFWYLNEEDVKKLKKFVNHLERLVASRKEEMVNRGRFRDYLVRVTKIYLMPEATGSNYLSVSQKFHANPFGDFGLTEWEEINPKTMGSKAYVVIKKRSRPLHFREVAEEINKARFDSKKALAQTIHNELIKDPRFVLVGRGRYGLKEQGYLPGTAREIIAYILKKRGPMTFPRVIEELSKQRFLEKNTIILNLHNKKYFKRLPNGKYSVK